MFKNAWMPACAGLTYRIGQSNGSYLNIQFFGYIRIGDLQNPKRMYLKELVVTGVVDVVQFC